MTRRFTICCLLTFAACSSSHSSPAGTGAVMSASIDANGGTVALEGATLTVPPGALPAGTNITVTSTKTAAPSSFSAFTPVFKFEPEGLTFAKAATIRLVPVAGAPSTLVVFWSNASGGFEALDTTSVGGAPQASVTHFSSGFGATPVPASMHQSCSATMCGACSVTCTDASPVAVCTEGSVDKSGACGQPSTCTCVAAASGNICSEAPTTECGAGCSASCTDPMPYATCVQATIMKTMTGGSVCVAGPMCTCSATATMDMLAPPAGDAGTK